MLIQIIGFFVEVNYRADRGVWEVLHSDTASCPGAIYRFGCCRYQSSTRSVRTAQSFSRFGKGKLLGVPCLRTPVVQVPWVAMLLPNETGTVRITEARSLEEGVATCFFSMEFGETQNFNQKTIKEMLREPTRLFPRSDNLNFRSMKPPGSLGLFPQVLCVFFHPSGK